MDIASKILSFEETNKLYGQREDKLPYPVIHKRGDQVIYFIAFSHTFNPENTQIAPLRELWQDFLRDSGTHRVALNEGSNPRPFEEDESDAISKYGEQGMVAHMAGKAGVKVVSPEPAAYSESHELIKRFPKDAIVYYYFARQLPQWHRMNPRPEFKSYMQNVLDNYKRALAWDDFDFSLDNLIKIHSELFKTKFDPEDNDFFHDQSNPHINKSVVQRVARECSHQRDLYIAKGIIDYWQQGYSIFGAFGTGHVYKLEPLIKDL